MLTNMHGSEPRDPLSHTVMIVSGPYFELEISATHQDNYQIFQNTDCLDALTTEISNYLGQINACKTGEDPIPLSIG